MIYFQYLQLEFWTIDKEVGSFIWDLAWGVLDTELFLNIVLKQLTVLNQNFTMEKTKN